MFCFTIFKAREGRWRYHVRPSKRTAGGAWIYGRSLCVFFRKSAAEEYRAGLDVAAVRRYF